MFYDIIVLFHLSNIHNESVELHVLSVEGSDKTRIRRTNGTPHLCMTRVAWGCAKRRASAAGVDTQEKSAVRKSLIRWKTVRFSIEDRVIALSVFYAGSLRQRKVRKIFQSRKQHSENSCVRVSSNSNPFGSSLILMDKKRRIYQRV